MVDQSDVKAFFVYGSLRPDDDSGQQWTKEACAGMTSRKAVVKNAQLFKDSFAVAVMDRPGHQIVGYVLTCQSDFIFDAKLTFYDTIEGYNTINARLGTNKRSVVTAHLVDK